MSTAQRKLKSVKFNIENLVLTNDKLPRQCRHVLETQLERIQEILNKKWKN